MAADLSRTTLKREAIWRRVHSDLLQHAIPDSRFHFDFSSFVPDFRGSSSAVDRLVQLPCYSSANTILISPDNSLERLRHRALKDGKKVVVATHKLRRGFVLLDPKRISDDKHELASWLDGMERPGVGQTMSLTQLEEKEKIDLCISGALAVSEQGVAIRDNPQHFGIQWGILLDRAVLKRETPVILVAHGCQVVDVEEEELKDLTPGARWETTPDFIVTPDMTSKVKKAERPIVGILFETLDPELLATTPLLQELKGIQMMEQIMQGAGFTQESSRLIPSSPDADEQLGIAIVEKLMRGYKA
jgi:5-formyltetrahydrofolate cyclo-ligase